MKENIDRKLESLYDSIEDSGSIEVIFEEARKLRVKNQSGNSGLMQGIQEDCERIEKQSGYSLTVKVEGEDLVIE